MLVKTELQYTELNEAEKSRLAMAIDTDGCISIGFIADGKYAYPSFQFVGHSVLPIVLAKKYGGAITERKQGVFRWMIVAHDDLENFLEATLSYLLLKKPQAKTALKMLKLIREKPIGWPSDTLKLATKLKQQNSDYKRPKKALEELL